MSEQVTIPQTYTAEQIAGILQISPDEVYRRGAIIPGYIKLSRRVTRWRRKDVDAWLDAGCPMRAA
jgi:predicted DNA-binding transcriptional regulator AlpA